MSKDMRRLNKVSYKANRNGEWYVFGEYGTGKNATVTTLAYAGKGKRGEEQANATYNGWKTRIGEVWTDLKKQRR
jgi:ABC-type molybdenum transport system ATPase subunit/photorepair protein PhrA